MPNRIFSNVRVTTQTSWSGTHGAKRAIVVSPQIGLDKPLPVSATLPPVTAKPVGTVAVLCQEANALARLRQSLADANVLIQQYFNLRAILADHAPVGPACLVVDLDGRDTADLQFYESLKARGWHLPTIMLAGHPDIRAVVQLMRAGAEDVLLKSVEPAELVAAINNALSESRKQLQRRSCTDQVQRRLERLTSRESEIVKLVLAGMLNKEIAERLHLALVTVKVHRASAMRKLGARSAAELARLTMVPNFSSPLYFTDRRTEQRLPAGPLVAG